MIINSQDLAEMDKLTRVQLATSLPGPKPICLVGTKSKDGVSNLAPFSSITHLGSNPVLIGMVTRPDTVERQTLRNILDLEAWTLSHVTPSIVEQAHQCSARYPSETSEFDATGLTESYEDPFPVPFVSESQISFGLQLEEIVPIPSNNTKLIVGRVHFIKTCDTLLSENGDLDLTKAQSLASTALDTYFSLNFLTKLPYAKVQH